MTHLLEYRTPAEDMLPRVNEAFEAPDCSLQAHYLFLSSSVKPTTTTVLRRYLKMEKAEKES